jgi:hypothetical protein
LLWEKGFTNMHGQITFGLITINLVSDNVYHGLVFKTRLQSCYSPLCTVFMFVKLWMVGVWQVPHPNQNTHASIESYYGALKCWFALDIKGFRGHGIDRLVWWLITTIARHYMHTLEMKKKGFIKNKVIKAILTQSVEKTTFIPFTHVY